MTTYIALMHHEPGAGYDVVFPDFPGCVTSGATLADARVLAAEALTFHIESLVEHGEPVPPPSSLEAVMADPEHAGLLPFLVTVDTPGDNRAVQGGT